MLVKPPLYGLAIAFDRPPGPTDPPTGVDGAIVLDPFASVIVGAGLSTIDGDEYYDGPERRILSLLDQRFAVLEPGIITTWNGSILDLPLLGARARALDIGLGLRIRPDRRRSLRLVGRTDPPPAQRPAYQIGGTRPVAGAWHRQRHLDLRWVYGDVTASDGITSPDPCRGAHLARALAERRWNRARRHLDRMPPAQAMTSYAWACLDADAEDGPMVEVPESARRRHPSAGLATRR